MKAIKISLSQFERSGGGKMGESYLHKNNPDVLLKLYPPQMGKTCLDEYERACKVFRTGIPSPEPEELVRIEDGRMGILYKRIAGKKSFARAISEHPGRLEQYAADFARVCKLLHAITPEPGLFPSIKELYIKEIGINPFLMENEKTGLVRFLKQLPDADTALHGDLHHGNVIFTEDGKHYFIDLSDFCTGTPLFDLGSVMMQTCWIPEEMEQDLYHIDMDTSKAFWRAFVKAYFGPESSLEEVMAMLQPYACLRVLAVERITGFPMNSIRPIFRAMIQ